MGLSQWFSSWLVSDETEREDGHPGTAVPPSFGVPHHQPRHKSSPPLDARTLHRLTQQSLRKCREELLKAYGTCWPSLQSVIEQSTDTSSRTHELKLLRHKDKDKDKSQESPPQTQDEASSSSSTNRLRLLRRQEELWKEIHVETLTRLVSTEYAATLLILSLTMQLHWIGGQVFQRKHSSNYHHHRYRHGHGRADPAAAAAAAPSDPARWAQDVMMESHHYMTHQGIPLLIAAVRRAVLTSFSASSNVQEEWTATTFVSKTQLETLLRQIDDRLERGQGSSRGTDVGGGGSSFSSNNASSYTRNWIRLVLPDPTLLMMDDGEDDDSSSEEDDD